MKPTIFCLTPVKNEEWIIDRFLKAASIWADHIIISDQGSTDKTIEIAKKYDKVIIIDNSDLKDFNEQKMREPLFNEARKFPGKKLLISLDADELLTPNFDSPEWDTILNADKGTRFIFNWYHIQPDFKTVCTTVENPCAFIDDGSLYDVGLIHVPRQPLPENVLYIKLNDIAILHFQFTNWERMQRKHIWYQMYERINFPSKSTIKIFRAFHYDKSVSWNTTFTMNNEWITLYKQLNIDITSVKKLPNYQWDETIVHYINKYSINYFKRIDLGNIDWLEKAKRYDNINYKNFILSKNKISNIVLSYLKHTQHIKNNFIIRCIDKILQIFF